MAKWETSKSIKDIITKIREDEIVLPVMQRRFVWDTDSMELLFDSLLKGNSFGAIICIEEEKDSTPLFDSRRFSLDGKDIDSISIDNPLSKTQWFVIDGQQRLQSFYIGLVGNYKGKRLYFDLFSDYSEEEYIFVFAEDESKIRLKSEDNERFENGGLKKRLWYPACELYERLKSSGDDYSAVSDKIIDDKSISNKLEEKHIEKNIRTFYNKTCEPNTIGISLVSVNKSKDNQLFENRERMIELFRRLNQGGTVLSASDLIASKLKGMDPEMEKFLDKITAEYSNIGIGQPELIKLILILGDKTSFSAKDVSDITKDDVTFASDNKVKVEETLIALKEFLKASRNYSWFELCGNRTAIPLYFLAYHIFHSGIETNQLKNMWVKFETDPNFENMSRWLRLSLLNRVFSAYRGWRPNTTGVRKIHEVLERYKGKEFPVNEIYKVYEERLNSFHHIEAEYLDTFDKEYIFYLVYSVRMNRDEDIDHIHPRTLLEQRYNEKYWDSIVNKQKKDMSTNRGSKSGKEYGTWLKNEFPDEKDRKEELDMHLIPHDENLWRSANFHPDFYEARADLLVEKLLQYR